MIKAIYFDHGGVLALNGRPGVMNRGIGKAMGLDEPADIVDLLNELKVSAISTDQFLASVNERYGAVAGKRIDNSVWRFDEIKTIYEPYIPMYELAEKCRNKGLVTGILSNIFPAAAKNIRDEGLYDGFDPVVLSCDERLCKPDQRFFDVAENRIDPIKSEEILLIDDQDKCIIAARARGWQTVQMDISQPEIAIAQVKQLVGIKM